MVGIIMGFSLLGAVLALTYLRNGVLQRPDVNRVMIAHAQRGGMAEWALGFLLFSAELIAALVFAIAQNLGPCVLETVLATGRAGRA